MDEMSINVEQCVSSARVHDVIVKDLVVQGSRGESWSRHFDLLRRKVGFTDCKDD